MMAKPWNEYRAIIIQLYIHEGRKLEDVRAIMKSKYNFEASPRSYRLHFDFWNIGKYNCKKRQRRRITYAASTSRATQLERPAVNRDNTSPVFRGRPLPPLRDAPAELSRAIPRSYPPAPTQFVDLPGPQMTSGGLVYPGLFPAYLNFRADQDDGNWDQQPQANPPKE